MPETKTEVSLAARIAADTVVKLVDAGLLGANLHSFDHIAGILEIPLSAITLAYKRQLKRAPAPTLEDQKPSNRARFEEKNPAPGLRACSRCGEVKSVTQFNVKNKVTGNRMPWCRPCGKAISRERYIAASEAKLVNQIRVVLRDGSPFVGDICPECTKPLEVGQRVCGSDVTLRHVNCRTARATLKLLSIAKGLTE